MMSRYTDGIFERGILAFLVFPRRIVGPRDPRSVGVV